MGATLGTRLLTWLRGELVGTDTYGNRYYRLKGDKPRRLGGGRFSRERRWVIYNGEPEGSKVPPEWHAWLHHTVNEVPQPRQRGAAAAAAPSVGIAAPAEPDRDALGLPPARLGIARRAPSAGDRRLRAVGAGIGAIFDPESRGARR